MAREASELELFEKLIEFAKSKGAVEAKIISADNVVVDERVRLKCIVPPCYYYNKHLFCPPAVMSIEEFRKILFKYKKALIVQLEADVDSTDKYPEQLRRENFSKLELETGEIEWNLKLLRLVNEIERAAFKFGFYLAAGLIAGNCHLCDECINPKSGECCRYPFESRPSMEAMGIDVYKTCQNSNLPFYFASTSKVRWTGLVLLC